MVAVKFWNRTEVQGHGSPQEEDQSDARADRGQGELRWLANLRQSTELLGEAARCVHIADREGDIWELFCLARELDHSLPRQALCRPVCGDGSHKVSDAMAEVEGPGTTPGRLAAPACATRQPSGHRSRRRRRDLQ